MFPGMFVNNALYFLNDFLRQENTISPYNFWNILKHIVLIVPHISYSSIITGFINISWKNNRFKICKSSNMEEASHGLY